MQLSRKKKANHKRTVKYSELAVSVDKERKLVNPLLKAAAAQTKYDKKTNMVLGEEALKSVIASSSLLGLGINYIDEETKNKHEGLVARAISEK